MRYVVDVYYVSRTKLATAAYVQLFRSWDGELYAESNVLAVCGPNRVVQKEGYRGGVASVEGVEMNCPLGAIRS